LDKIKEYLKKELDKEKPLVQNSRFRNDRFECTANEYLVKRRNEGNYRKLNHGLEKKHRTENRDRGIRF
jgi:hypothetical protein